jgi:hypothetical protein
MTIPAFEVHIPATEIEIASAIKASDPWVADIIRKLAFERDRLVGLVDRHAAEINRRRGEMAVAREFLDEQGVPKTRGGTTLTFRQRLQAFIRGGQHRVTGEG